MAVSERPSEASDVQPLLDSLALIEASATLADTLDQLKRDLESRGWSSTSAEQASLVVLGPLIQAAAVNPNPGRK